eukprot:868-Heterococcus_DN1.PRE.6
MHAISSLMANVLEGVYNSLYLHGAQHNVQQPPCDCYYSATTASTAVSFYCLHNNKMCIFSSDTSAVVLACIAATSCAQTAQASIDAIATATLPHLANKP